MLNRASTIFLLIIAATISVALIVLAVTNRSETPAPETISITASNNQAQPVPLKTEQPAALPARVVLNVPFFSQAPFGVWDELHGEACEEASFLMVKAYVNQEQYTLEEFDQEIIDFIHWQTNRGYKVDITLSELAEVAKQYYRFGGARLIVDPTIEQIKREVAAGRPVIIPAAGRQLPNPNFRSPGPLYHMLVVKGYDQDGFITNDPGTRNGNNFRYTYQDLYYAIHDWNPADITLGKKIVLVYDR